MDIQESFSALPESESATAFHLGGKSDGRRA
jgi:hypothetical protein